MTNEDIIRMANEARLCACKWVNDDDDRDVESLYDFAALIAAAEREACAKFLLSTDLSGLNGDPALQNFIANLLANYAEAIRARGRDD